MKTFFTLAAFAAGSNALVGRTNGCCFHLTASGGASGSVGQLSDGQNRIGDNSLPPATYCIDSTGGITDSSGRGCILTPPTTQFQCDTGATPTTGFSVSSSGQLMFQGNTSFIACETGQNGGMNIYTTNSSAVTMCNRVQLNANACSGSGASPAGSSSAAASSTPVASVSPVQSTPTGSTPASSAPAPSTPVASVSPVQSTPTGSAPASSAPAPSTPVASVSPVQSTPAGSAPASSAPLPGPPSTVVSTVTATAPCICSATSVPGAPAPAPSGSAPAPSSSAPAPKPSSSSFSSVPIPSGSPSPSAPAGQSSGASSVPASSASAVPSGTSSAAPSGTSTAGACATTLSSGNFESPHLIIPINSASPNTASGTQYNGTVNSTVSSIFNFDIPSSDTGKTCSLVFLFPQKADLQTSSFDFSGDGKIDVAQLSSPASSSTNFNNAPSVMKNLGVMTVSPGSNHVISTFSCPAGQTVAYEMKNAGTTDLTFFEDYNPSPIGLFITVC